MINGGIIDKTEVAVNMYENADKKQQNIIDEIHEYMSQEIGEYEDSSKDEVLKIGDYVNYDPTLADKNGNKIDLEGVENLKWRVWDIDEISGKVELISEEPEEEELIIYGSNGWSDLEKMLAEECSGYGYGYGADKSIGANYTVGDKEYTIEGTGARNISIEDIEKKLGITEDDKKNSNSHYGVIDKISIPLDDGENLEIEIIDNTYNLDILNTDDPILRDLLIETEGGYWVDGRWNVIIRINDESITGYENATVEVLNLAGVVKMRDGGTYFLSKLLEAFYVVRSNINNEVIDMNFNDEGGFFYGIRPIITLVPNIIDLSSGDGSSSLPYTLK